MDNYANETGTKTRTEWAEKYTSGNERLEARGDKPGSVTELEFNPTEELKKAAQKFQDFLLLNYGINAKAFVTCTKVEVMWGASRLAICHPSEEAFQSFGSTGCPSTTIAGQ